MAARARSLLIATLVAAATACSEDHIDSVSMLSQAEAITAVEAKLVNDGYALDDFNLDPAAGQNAPLSESWTFVYGCKPVQTEGCFLLVTIDRITGKAEISAGDSVKKSRT